MLEDSVPGGSVGALDGIRVLDFSRVLAGPYCAMVLADLGAEVWKIEHPRGGDETRTWLPPDLHGTSTYYLAVNRSKKSVAIDLKTPDGATLVRALADQADVVLANFLPGVLERLGLDYPALARRNPRAIHCTISGYGVTGSRAGQAGYDLAIQAESGLMSINGEPGGAPHKYGVAITDVLGGMNAVQAILAALVARGRTGRGQSIDLALLDGAIAALINVASASLNAGAGTGRYGNAHPSIVPYQSFATADGAIVVACGNDRQFGDLCVHVLRRPELARDERFATNVARVANRGAIVAAIAAAFAAAPTAELLAALRRANVPAGEIRSVPDALAAPEVAERGMIAAIPDPVLGEVRVPASPLRLSANPPRPPSPPPRLGEHTRDVLGAVLGLDAAALDRLERAGAIRCAPD